MTRVVSWVAGGFLGGIALAIAITGIAVWQERNERQR